MSTKLLDLVNITKSYDGVTILDDLIFISVKTNFLPSLARAAAEKQRLYVFSAVLRHRMPERFYLTDRISPSFRRTNAS
mgnify:CR=1 FL=1